MPKPFLKWAGGKRQLLKSLIPLLPKSLSDGRIERYVEPFLGGGALFFHLAEMGFAPKRSLLCDANPELTLVYRIVQTQVDKLIKSLAKLETNYLKLPPETRQIFYLKQRTDFNRDREGFSFVNLTPDSIWRASLFIFLNRTGYNGLWRVNQDGGFNVPFGRYLQPRICDEPTLRATSFAMKHMNADIHTGDFQKVLKKTNQKTFVYYDPPYRPVSASSNFNTYTSSGFGDHDQKRLAASFMTLHQQGAYQMLSNSESKDHFFENLYCHPNWEIISVKARRSINSRAVARGPVNEIVVVNYPLNK